MLLKKDVAEVKGFLLSSLLNISKLNKKAISQAKPLFSDIDLPSRPQATLSAAINKYARR